MPYVCDRPQKPKSHLTLVLAHGAGAPMDSDFMTCMARLLNQRGISVVRFEFPYMAERRVSGKKRPPNRMPELMKSFYAAVDYCGGPELCVVGGKSMGGRVASMLLAEGALQAAVSLGYPFHPAGKPDNLRKDHWGAVEAPWLIVQGSRDPMGKREEVERYELPSSALVKWLDDGDHDFKPRKASGLTQSQHWVQAADWVSEFIVGLS